jgi:hypothetical protein
LLDLFITALFRLVLQKRKIFKVRRWKHVLGGGHALAEFHVETVVGFAEIVDFVGRFLVDLLDVGLVETEFVVDENREADAEGAQIAPDYLLFGVVVVVEHIEEGAGEY